jgi:regulator of replication initiation timing
MKSVNHGKKRINHAVPTFSMEETMGDIVSTISTAISLASRLKKISENIKDAEFKNLLADLGLELAEVKMKLALLIEENTNLKVELNALKNAEGDPCPRCHKRGWHLEDSKPDKLFGDLGGMRRIYRCSFCGFKEEQLIAPK